MHSEECALVEEKGYVIDVRKKEIEDRLKILTNAAKHVLDEQNFRCADFWEGYKLYCFARYSQCKNSRSRFLSSKMGRVFMLIQEESNVRWGVLSDEKVRHIWSMMEEYAEVFHGRDWRNIRSLMEEFDDVKELSASENGCLLLQLVEDDDYGTERLHMKSHAIEVYSTNIFDELQGRLKRVGSNLDRLMESSGVSSKGYKNGGGKRCS